MKICSKCNKRKSFTSFTKNLQYKDNYNCWCKDCCNKYEKARLILFPWKRFLKLIKQRCNDSNHSAYKYYGGKGIKYSITYEELKFLWFRDKAYNMYKPSIDRKDNDGNYELDNCQFIELSINSAKRNMENIIRSIVQYDLNNNFIKEYSSLTLASINLNIDCSCITKCAKNKRKTAGGYIWKYKEHIDA